jgi:hypothetical protein
VVTIKDRDKFKEAIRTKLILEVAGRTPERRIVPVAEKEPRVPCLIGEKLWQPPGEVSVDNKTGHFAIGLPCPFMAHETVMPALSPQVRYERVSGPSFVAVRGPSLTQAVLLQNLLVWLREASNGGLPAISSCHRNRA